MSSCYCSNHKTLDKICFTAEAIYTLNPDASLDEIIKWQAVFTIHWLFVTKIFNEVKKQNLSDIAKLELEKHLIRESNKSFQKLREGINHNLTILHEKRIANAALASLAAAACFILSAPPIAIFAAVVILCIAYTRDQNAVSTVPIVNIALENEQITIYCPYCLEEGDIYLSHENYKQHVKKLFQYVSPKHPMSPQGWDHSTIDVILESYSGLNSR